MPSNASEEPPFKATNDDPYRRVDKVDKIVSDDGCPHDVRSWLKKEVSEVIYAKGTKSQKESV